MFSKSLKDFFTNPIITLPLIIFIGLNQLLGYLLLGNVTQNITLEGFNFDLQFVTTILIFILVSLVISLFIYPMMYSWSATMAKDTVNGIGPSFFHGFRDSLQYYWRLLGINILVSFIIMVISAVFSFIIILNVGTSVLSSPEELNRSLGTLAIPLSLVLTLVITFFTVALLPIRDVLIYDDLSIGKAFSNGYKLGTKKFFSIIGSIMFISLCIGSLFYVLTMFTDVGLITRILSTVIIGYFSVFPTVYILNLYSNEGFSGGYKQSNSLPESSYNEIYKHWNETTTTKRAAPIVNSLNPDMRDEDN